MEKLDDMGRIRVTAKLDGWSSKQPILLVASSILIHHMLKHCWNTYVSIPTSMTGKVLLHCFVHCESVLAIPLLINEISSNIIAVDSCKLCKRFKSAFFRIILWAPLSWFADVKILLICRHPTRSDKRTSVLCHVAHVIKDFHQLQLQRDELKKQREFNETRTGTRSVMDYPHVTGHASASP